MLALHLVAEHVPNVERMMRGVMVACGVSREEIERLLRERREQMKQTQKLAS
jgi:bacterioferritin-associated ferredoxin